MPIDVTVHYSENLPSGDNSYKTRRFTCELKQVLADGADITEATQKLFMVAKANVQSQVERAKSDLALGELADDSLVAPPAPAAPSGHQPAPQHFPFPAPAPQSNGNGSAKPATDKQIKYLFRLARTAGLKNDEVRNLPMQYFNKPTLESLSSQEASRLIETLSGEGHRKAA